jgi:5-methylcytosine-specific restriction endonuclease McrA
MAELEQVRAALSHKCPGGGFEEVVREAFKLVLERDRKRKALADRPRLQPETSGEDDRYVPAAIKRAVWERDHGRCTWPMGDGELCGSTHRLEFDHDLEVALGGKATIDNIRLLCKGHNLMKAEQHLGKALMAKFRKGGAVERDMSSG